MANSDGQYIERLDEDMGEGVKDFISQKEALQQSLMSKFAALEAEANKEMDEKQEEMIESGTPEMDALKDLVKRTQEQTKEPIYKDDLVRRFEERLRIEREKTEPTKGE